MKSFKELNLPETFIKSLEKMGLTTPTPIQAQTIPLALAKHDILGSAQTGTGKTLAFTLPLVKHLLDNPESTALVLAPIREIAQQVMNTLKIFMSDSKDFNVALLIGGEPYPKQLSQLKSRPRVVIGTPGRVIDHLERGTLRVNKLECLALDETDRMFDMGFGIQLDHIISKLPAKRQTLMFSATIAPAIEKLAAKYLNEPKRVAVGSATLPIPKIKQEIVKISEKEKYNRLLQELDQRDGTVLVFVKTKMNADRLAISLRKEDHSASAIHGDLRQRQREKVIHSFRQGKCRVLVATDIAARGLDIPHLMHVINYDVPPCPEDYIHRIGRTGRAGAEGFSLCFVTSQDAKKWNAIERYMNPKAYEGSNHNSNSEKNFGRSARPTGGSPFGNDRKRKPFASGSFGESRDGSRGSGFGGAASRGGSRSSSSGGFGNARRSMNAGTTGRAAPRSNGFGGEGRSFSDTPRESRSNSRGSSFSESRPGSRSSSSGGFGGARRENNDNNGRAAPRSNGFGGEGRRSFAKPGSRRSHGVSSGSSSSKPFAGRSKSGAAGKRTFN